MGKLQIKNLTKIYDEDIFKKAKKALDGVSFNVTENECTGLIGHNGAGKTTLIRMIFNLLKPTSGEILYQSKPINEKALHEFGYMPEVDKLPGLLTAPEILNFRLSQHKFQKPERSHLIQSALERVGLGDKQKLKLKSMSKGMKRKVAWLFATIHNPQIIVLDEPFSGLDPVAKVKMSEWIREYSKKNVTILLCTHDFWAIENICDDLVVLNGGKLVYDSSQLDAPESSTQQEYLLSLSGISADVFDSFSNNPEIPKPLNMTRDGFRSNFILADEKQFHYWLNLAMSNGFPIIKAKQTVTNLKIPSRRELLELYGTDKGIAK